MRRINSDPDGRQPDWEGLERLVQAALDGFKSIKRPDANALCSQIDAATIDDIDFTGHGFYARLSMSKVGPTLWTPTMSGALLGAAIGGDERIGLNLFLDKGGRILCLEGFNCGDAPFTGAPLYTIDVSGD